MSLLLLIMGGAFLTSLLLSNQTEDDSDSTESSEENDPDNENPGGSDHSDDLDHDEENNVGDEDDSNVDSPIVIEGVAYLTVSDDGYGYYEFQSDEDDFDQYAISGRGEYVSITWKDTDAGALISSSTPEGIIEALFIGISPPPLSSFKINFERDDGTEVDVLLSDFPTSVDEGRTITVFDASILTRESASDVAPIQVSGSANSDHFLVYGDGSITQVAYERGEFYPSGSLTASIDLDSGDDMVKLIDGTYSVSGGDGADQISALDSAILAFGGAGNDSLMASSWSSFLSGDLGDDTVVGSNEGDTILGGEGRDELFGLDGNDLLDGAGMWLTDPGQRTTTLDQIIDDSSDSLFGGGGEDTLVASGGDHVYGGTGSDIFQVIIREDTEPVQIYDFETEDALEIELVMQEGLETMNFHEMLEVRTYLGGVEVWLANKLLVVLPNSVSLEVENIRLKVSFADDEGNYLG